MSNGLMRVLVLSTWFPYPPDNGAKIRAHYLVRALAERHHVTLIAFRPPSNRWDSANDAYPDRVRVTPVPVDPFRHVNALQFLKYASPIPLAFWPSRAMRRAVDDALRAENYNAVVAIQTPVAQYAVRVNQARRILDVDTSFSYQMERRHARAAGLRTWFSWQKTHYYEQRVFRQFQACAVVASQEVPFVQSMVAGTSCRVEVVANGVDCQRNRPGLSPVAPNRLIYTGALTYQANYNAVKYFLDEIYPIVRESTPEVNLTVTGSKLGVDLSRLKLDDSVLFSGYVDDVRPLVSSSSICVVPIQEGGGTRLKILEAMALGTPVISTSKGAEGLVVTHNEHLLIADDPIVFAEGVLRLLNEPDLRERLTTNARRLVEQHYDWDQIGRRFVDLIEIVN